MNVFDRDKTFDPLVDSIVRVEALRLRSKLAKYYAGAGKAEATVIALPKGRYQIVIAVGSAEDRVEPHFGKPRREVTVGGENHGLIRSAVEHSIAELPFDNSSGDLEQEYFSDGIAEDIMTGLAKLSGLRARHSTFFYKNRPVNCRDICENLGVDYFFAGSVRKASGRVRITVQLIGAPNDTHLLAERYDRQLDDVFDIQDDVTVRIVRSLAFLFSRVPIYLGDQPQAIRNP